MNPVANVLDLEFNDDKSIIEIGLTFVHLQTLEIQKTVSYAIWPQPKPLAEEIVKLTGWTDKKLEKQGRPLNKVVDGIIQKYGVGRILVVDSADELYPFSLAGYGTPALPMPFQGEQVNVSNLFRIAFELEHDVSLEYMLNRLGMVFDGRKHRAGDDSKNIARLFVQLMKAMKTGINSDEITEAARKVREKKNEDRKQLETKNEI